MAGSGSELKECWYSVLGVERTSTPEEIRSAYRKEALKWHPDKTQQSGASVKECQQATARFQSIVQAYEVLSDPVERSWNGFYKVYKEVFVNIHKKEQAFAKAYGMGPIGEAPQIGTPNSPYVEVEEFYKYWTGFVTVKDFSWCDEYQVFQAPNRKVRRLMEEENAKIRKRERRQFNDAVRDLATFVKKRDKRWLERQVELQRLQKEKDLQFRLWKQKLQQEKIAKARSVQEQEWTKVHSVLDEDDGIEDVNEGSYVWKSGSTKKIADEDLQEFYCIICSKRFRSEKQWKNHEKSKKHNDRASTLKLSILDEDEVVDAQVDDLDLEIDINESAEDQSGMATEDSNGVSRAIDVEKLAELKRLREGDAEVFLDTGKGSSDNLQKEPATLEPNISRVQRKDEQKDESESEENEDETLEDDDEDSVLAAMMNSRKTRLAVPPAEFEATRDGEAQEKLDGSREQNGGGSSSDSDGGNAVDEDNDESLFASVGSRRNQSRHSSDEKFVTEKSGEPEESNPEVVSILVDDILSGDNLGKCNSRRRSKAEKQHTAAEQRHDDILKEFSSIPEGVQNGNVDGEEEDTQLGASLSVEETNNSQSSLNQKKKKLQRGQKKGMLEMPGKQGSPNAVALSQQKEPVNNKGSSKSKKGKGAAKSATNTCDTCGENFDSRSQLFRHISLTNHGTLKSR